MKCYKYAFGLSLVLLASCNSRNIGKKTMPDKLAGRIEKRLGSDSSTENNFDNTYVLAWKEDNSSGTIVIQYGVWVIVSGELLYAGSAIRGNVKWLDNTSLLVEDYPGIVDGEQKNFKFKIDLKTKVKTPIHERQEL